MMNRRVLALLLLAATLVLSGCLFTVNHPVVLPDGRMALFLDEKGGYSLFPEGGVLYLLEDDVWTPVPLAGLATGGGLLDRSPDGSELLYLEIGVADVLGPITSTLYRVSVEPGGVPEILLSTERAVAKAAWMMDGLILLLFFGEDGLGSLEVLDPQSGDLERLERDVLSFDASRESGRIDTLRVDQDGDLTAGVVERTVPKVLGRREQAIFQLSEQTLEVYALLPHELLWDVSSDGRWIALSLFDPTIIEPEPEQEVPSLYLIDTELDSVQRIAGEGLAPAFSPEGQWLAYLTSPDGITPVVMLRDLESEESVEVIEGTGAASLFWLGSDCLGFVFEGEDNKAALVEHNVRTGEGREIISLP